MATARFTRWFPLATAVALAVSLPAARAQPAVAAKSINLRAGPGRDYPLVLQVGAGTPLTVQGCVGDYSWCDVTLPGNYRGWVYAGNISYAYQDNRVPLLQYGAVIGLPIVGFTLGSYWSDHYRGRPFYRDRNRWEHRPMPYRPAYRPPPPPNFGRPGVGARPPGDGHFPGAGRPGGPGRFDGGARPPFGGTDHHGGARPDRGPPGGERHDAGRVRSGGPGGGGGRPDGGGGGHHGGGHDGRPGR